MSVTLKALFEPFDGECIKEKDGFFVVWVPYAHPDPIVVSSRDLAEQVEKAIQDAYGAGTESVGRE